jgi:hypothetical protein
MRIYWVAFDPYQRIISGMGGESAPLGLPPASDRKSPFAFTDDWFFCAVLVTAEHA